MADEPNKVRWRKASRSQGTGDCVEIAATPGGVLVRDSKNPESGVLRVRADAWGTFVKSVNP